MHYPYVVSAPQVICGVSQLFRDIVDSRRALSSSYAAVPAFVNFWSLSEYYTSIATDSSCATQARQLGHVLAL